MKNSNSNCKNLISYFNISNFPKKRSAASIEANNNTKRNYFWEVETVSGKAKGYSSTEYYANKMIDLVASGDAIVSKIIISQPQQ